jgi:hypothetical protein
MAKNQIAPARSLVKQAYVLLKSSWKNFAIFTLIYACFMIVLVQGPASVSITDIQASINESLPAQSNNNTLLAGVFVGQSAALGQTAAVYSVFLFFIFSMAAIWLIRASREGTDVKVRDSFYVGMTGLIPVVIIFALIIAQLLPIALGGLLYSIVNLNSLSVGLAENVLWAVFILSLILVSFYMITASLQAVYIASLPEVRPSDALKKARSLVQGRRFTVMFRILTGIIVYGLIASAVLLLIIATVPVLAPYWWWFVGIVSLPIGHSYFYSLYRSLI